MLLPDPVATTSPRLYHPAMSKPRMEGSSPVGAGVWWPLLLGLLVAAVTTAAVAFGLPLWGVATVVFWFTSCSGYLLRRSAGQTESDAGSSVVAIADSMPDALLCFSLDGTIRYSNRMARELFFEGESKEGRNFHKIMEGAPKALREALFGENDRLLSIETDGWPESYYVSRRELALHDRPHSVLLVRRLTRQVGRRDVDTLKRVVRMISHEVNNSLAPIASLVNSVKVAAARPEHHGRLAPALDTIAERAAHLKTFIDGYARLARLPAPKAEEVDWSGPLGHLQGLYPALSVSPAPSRPGYFDAVQMEQVLVNLVKNAIEAGSAESEVALFASVQNDGSTDIEILDRGRGFSEEALAQALLPLFTTKEHGSGMGLTLCKEIVEAHGGSLGLSNRDDGGARIRIVLPGPSLAEEVDLTRSRLTLTYG